MQAPLPQWKWEQTKHKFIRLLENPVFLKENKEKVTWSDRTFHSVFKKTTTTYYFQPPQTGLLFNSFIAKQNKYTYSVISQLHFKQTHATIKNFPRLTMGMCADVPPCQQISLWEEGNPFRATTCFCSVRSVWSISIYNAD